MTQMKWGVICSVPDDSDLEKLKNFADWLVTELEMHSERFYLYHNFEDAPEFCFACTPGDKQNVYSTYEKIHKKHADVTYVIHILPKRNCMEFNILKDVTVKYALVGQGILLEKALSRFADCDLSAVLENMNQYISRRLSQIICYKRSENAFRLMIRGTQPLSIHHYANHEERVNHDLTKCVEMILHSNKQKCLVADGTAADENSENASRCLIVSGFPSSFNKLQIAAIFSIPFTPLSIAFQTDGTAVAEFVNKFHAAQALLAHHRNDASVEYAQYGFTLSLKSADPMVETNVNNCLLKRKMKEFSV